MKRYDDSDSEIDDEDIDELEALLAGSFQRGEGKYKGKMPIDCFNCHEVVHIVAGCPEKKKRRNDRDKDNYKSRDKKYEDKYKSIKDDDYRSNKDKNFYSKDKKKRMKIYANSDSETNDEDIDELEALLARRFHKGKGKYKGKMPIIFFNYYEVGHISKMS